MIMKKIAVLLALVLKFTILYFILNFGFKYFNPNAAIYIQNPLVWVLIYIPTFMGYERIINIIFSNKKIDNDQP